MLNLVRAEWRKALANYKLVSFLVWIIPVGIFAFYLVMILLSLVSDPLRAGMEFLGSGAWTTDSLESWNMMVAFPSNLFLRLFPLAFMAVVFAGEYGWRTWKSVVPRTRRWKLILAKSAALVGLVMLSMFLTALISALGPITGFRLHGLAYGPAISLEVLSGFLLDTLRRALVTTLTLTVLAGYASLAALLTRSVLGGLLAAFGVSILDNVSLPLLKLVGLLLDRPNLVNLYQYTPSYNLSNLLSWLVNGRAIETFAPELAISGISPGFWISARWLALWIFCLLGLALFIFQRQDITE